jgi:hypothetical protein
VKNEGRTGDDRGSVFGSLLAVVARGKGGPVASCMLVIHSAAESKFNRPTGNTLPHHLIHVSVCVCSVQGTPNRARVLCTLCSMAEVQR